MSQAKRVSLGNAPANKAPAPIGRRPKLGLQPLPGLPVPRGDRDREDVTFLPAALEILETPPSRVRTGLGYAICLVIAIALGWSFFGHFTVYAVATGKIQTPERTKVVQPIEAGQVVAIRAKDGTHVKQGDVLIELNPTDALANESIIKDKLVDVRADMNRLRVELKAADARPINTHPAISWDESVPAPVRTREESILAADLSQLSATVADLTAQRHSKEVAKNQFSASVEAQKTLIAAQTERTAMHEKLEQQGWDSRAKLLEAQQPLQQQKVDLASLQGSMADATAQVAVLDSELAKAVETFKTSATQNMADAERQANELTQQLSKASITAEEMTLRAPETGIVQGSAVTSVGQMVKPGQQLMQVVPDDKPLIIEAYVLNTDIGFVSKDQNATIKVDTFPYTRYGTIAGKVIWVASDAIPGSQALQLQKNGSDPETSGSLSATAPAEHTSDLVFPVKVALSKSSINVDGRETPLSSGMSVVVEIETEQQRFIDYLLYPLARGISNSGGPTT